VTEVVGANPASIAVGKSERGVLWRADFGRDLCGSAAHPKNETAMNAIPSSTNRRMEVAIGMVLTERKGPRTFKALWLHALLSHPTFDRRWTSLLGRGLVHTATAAGGNSRK
jgi:hypothetical protein